MLLDLLAVWKDRAQLVLDLRSITYVAIPQGIQLLFPLLPNPSGYYRCSFSGKVIVLPKFYRLNEKIKRIADVTILTVCALTPCLDSVGCWVTAGIMEVVLWG